MSVDKLWAIAKEHGVLEIANFVLTDPRFPIWSGSSKPHQHHYGDGGLAQHTFEVVDLCLSTNAYFAKIGKDSDPRKVVLAALFHDCGKMWDYEQTVWTQANADNYTPGEWQGNKHKRLVHHISRSALVWNQALQTAGPKISFFDPDNDILHAILAHHGQREWGSPVSPGTRLAWLLHLCDGLSARLDDCDKWDRHGGSHTPQKG